MPKTNSEPKAFSRADDSYHLWHNSQFLTLALSLSLRLHSHFGQIQMLTSSIRFDVRIIECGEWSNRKRIIARIFHSVNLNTTTYEREIYWKKCALFRRCWSVLAFRCGKSEYLISIASFGVRALQRSIFTRIHWKLHFFSVAHSLSAARISRISSFLFLISYWIQFLFFFCIKLFSIHIIQLHPCFRFCTHDLIVLYVIYGS